MNRTRAAFTLIAVLALLAFAGCGSSDDSTSSTDATDTTATDTVDTTSTDTVDTTSTDATDTTSDDSDLRSVFTQGLESSLAGKGLPADYVQCVIDKAQTAVSDDEILDLGKQVQAGDSSAAEKIGTDLGKECVAEGAGIDAFRAKLTGSIRSSLKGSDLSQAYQDCVVSEAGKQISDDELASILVIAVDDPAAAQTKSQAIGRKLGKKCLDDGVKP